MLIDLKLKKQVSSEQLDALVQFLKEYPELAKGLTRGRRGKLNTFKLWNLGAKKLNVLKDGATKDGKMWSKVNHKIHDQFKYILKFKTKIILLKCQS